MAGRTQIRWFRYVVSSTTILFAILAFANESPAPAPRPGAVDPILGIAFVDGSVSTLILERDGKKYVVDLTTRSVREIDPPEATATPVPSSSSNTQSQPPAAEQQHRTYYIPGDSRLFTLPTGAQLPRHAMSVDFTHRFAYAPAFKGPARGQILLGLDDISVSSFGFAYGVSNRLAISVYRSPSLIQRPIELMAGYSVTEERRGQPFNLTFRISVDGQNDFQRNFTTNLEAIVSRSLTPRAALFFVPTFSYHNRPVLTVANTITVPPPYQPCAQPFATGVDPALHVRPCANTFSLGVGVAVDVRPTVALVAEVNPTLANAEELGIHRPPFSLGIQKKIWRHAFTFGFTTAPGTTVAQRSGTRATFVQNPNADTPNRLFIGFNLSRQLH